MTTVRLLLSGLCFAAASLQSLHVSAAEEGKFYLVYLVAAVDLKPGSKVTVDPVFFTNGKEVRGFHRYCGSTAWPDQFLLDRQFVDSYCAKKSVTLDPKGFHSLNNHGQQITLGAIEFRIVGETQHFERPEEKDPVILGYSAIQSSTPGSIDPPKWLRGDGAPEYFFLMSEDKGVLEQIVPVAKATQAQVEALAKRAVEFSKIAKGKTAGGLVNARDIEKAKVCYAPNPMVEFRLENPLVVDIDLDNKFDLLVNVYSVHRLDSESGRPLVACFTNYRILGSGETILVGNDQRAVTPWRSLGISNPSYPEQMRNGYVTQRELLLIRVLDKGRACNYRVAYGGEQGMSHPQGYMLWATGTQCGYGHSFMKQKPPIDDPR